VLNLLGNAVRGTGNMTLHAGVLVGCVIAHIALAPILMFGCGPFPALGPAGAGWGLVIPFGVSSLVMILYLRSSRSIIRLNFQGVVPRWALFADILKVGVPGLINTSITNLSVVVLTGIAGQFGPETAIGYAMGARLEYIMQPRLWLWNSDRCDGGDELGRAAVWPRSPDCLDGSGDDRASMRDPGINRRSATQHLAGLIQC
jgi:Na+-driven multidrug efflux pump